MRKFVNCWTVISKIRAYTIWWVCFWSWVWTCRSIKKGSTLKYFLCLVLGISWTVVRRFRTSGIANSEFKRMFTSSKEFTLFLYSSLFCWGFARDSRGFKTTWKLLLPYNSWSKCCRAMKKIFFFVCQSSVLWLFTASWSLIRCWRMTCSFSVSGSSKITVYTSWI